MNTESVSKKPEGNAINTLLTPVYSVDTLHCYCGENYFTHDKKFKICHYPNCGYWEISDIGSCNIYDFITRAKTIQDCVDFLNGR